MRIVPKKMRIIADAKHQNETLAEPAKKWYWKFLVPLMMNMQCWTKKSQVGGKGENHKA